MTQGADNGVPWAWRNTRDVGFSVHVWPISWGFGATAEGDVYAMDYRVTFGPFTLILHVNIGSPSRGWGLCELEAYDRAEAAARRRK